MEMWFSVKLTKENTHTLIIYTSKKEKHTG